MSATVEGSSFEEILKHMTIQNLPLRSSLNTNLLDVKTLEYLIRRNVVSPNRLSAQNILKDHYARNLMQTSTKAKPNHSNLAIPLKHRRSVSNVYEQMKFHRPTPKIQVTTQMSTPRLGTSPVLTEIPESKSVRFQIDIPKTERKGWMTRTLGSEPSTGSTVFPTPRNALTSRRTEDIVELKAHCSVTSIKVKQEQRSVKKKKIQVLRGLKRCSKAVERALKLDIHGYVPKPLAEYKRKKAEERAARGVTLKKPPPVHIQHEVIQDYRRDMLQKALQHGIDKDMRYIYTFGSCSAINT